VQRLSSRSEPSFLTVQRRLLAGECGVLGIFNKGFQIRFLSMGATPCRLEDKWSSRLAASGRFGGWRLQPVKGVAS
jgi:hypothetical protein